jgi:uncharacterized RDD family membrane protein YckC
MKLKDGGTTHWPLPGLLRFDDPLFAGIIWVAFDRRKQGWHDKLADTVVVRKKGPEPVSFSRPA